MRTLAITLAAALVAAGCSSTSTTRTDAHAAAGDMNAPIEASGAVIAVRGLSCPKCATGLDQQLAKIDGVRKVNVDLSSGDITVDFDLHPRPTRAQLARAVHDSGVTLVSITPRH